MWSPSKDGGGIYTHVQVRARCLSQRRRPDSTLSCTLLPWDLLVQSQLNCYHGQKSSFTRGCWPRSNLGQVEVTFHSHCSLVGTEDPHGDF